MVYGWFACLRLTNVYHLWANLQFSPLNIKAQFEDKLSFSNILKWDNSFWWGLKLLYKFPKFKTFKNELN